MARAGFRYSSIFLFLFSIVFLILSFSVVIGLTQEGSGTVSCSGLSESVRTISPNSILYRDAGTMTNYLNALSAHPCLKNTEFFQTSLKPLIVARKELLSDLIHENPDLALQLQPLSPVLVKKLSPKDILTLIEHRGTFVGYIDIVHYDDFETQNGGEYRHYLRVANGQKQRRLEIFSSRDNLFPARSSVALKGLLLGNTMAVESRVQSQGITSQPLSSAAENTGVQKTLVILAQIGSDSLPLTVAEINDSIFGNHDGTLRDFYLKNSYNKIIFSGDLVGPFMIPAGVCLSDEVESLVLSEAFKNKIKIENYDRLIIVQTRGGCQQSSSASIGKYRDYRLPSGALANISIARVILRLGDDIRSLFLYSLFHEVGHTLGSSHSGAYSCYDANGSSKPFSYFCQSKEYGDPYSIMGGNIGHHTGSQKKAFRWIDDSQMATVTNGTFLLRPLEQQSYLSNDSFIQLIRLPVTIETSFYAGMQSIYYTLELRQSIDSYDRFKNTGLENYSGGVLVHLSVMNDSSTSTYLKTNLIESSPTSFLVEGSSFKDSINGYIINVSRITSEGAIVTIQNLSRKEPNFFAPISYYNFTTILNSTSYQKDIFADSGGYIPGFETVTSVQPMFEAADFYDKNSALTSGKFFTLYAARQNAFTISFWVKPLSFSESSQMIYSFNGLSPALYLDSHGKLIFCLSTFDVSFTKTPCISSLQKIPLNNWTNIVALYNSTHTILYVNGVLQNSSNLNSYISKFLKKDIFTSRLKIIPSASPVIGKKMSGKIAFNGSIDEVRFYARSLSEQETSVLYKNVFVAADGHLVLVDSKNRGNISQQPSSPTSPPSKVDAVPGLDPNRP